MLFISIKLIYFVVIMASVGFLTLFERKVLAFSQNRISVNKNTYVGLLQPLLDALKLFIKMSFYTSYSLKSFFMLAPMFMFISYYFCWEINNMDMTVSFKYQLLLLLCIIGLTIYATVLASLVSFNKYSMLSGIRIIMQTVCFEINITILIFFLIYSSSTSEFAFNNFLLQFLMGGLFFLLMMLETMRGCFDMGESESELVSAFNLEFGALLFVLMFLSEYSSIMFMCFFFWSIFLGKSLISYFGLLLFFMFIRCFMMRLKIDAVISFMWLKFLPYCIFSFLFFI